MRGNAVPHPQPLSRGERGPSLRTEGAQHCAEGQMPGTNVLWISLPDVGRLSWVASGVTAESIQAQEWDLWTDQT